MSNFKRIEDVPADHVGPFTVGHIKDRSEMTADELRENAAWDRADALIDHDDTIEVRGSYCDKIAPTTDDIILRSILEDV